MDDPYRLPQLATLSRHVATFNCFPPAKTKESRPRAAAPSGGVPPCPGSTRPPQGRAGRKTPTCASVYRANRRLTGPPPWRGGRLRLPGRRPGRRRDAVRLPGPGNWRIFEAFGRLFWTPGWLGINCGGARCACARPARV